MRLKPILAAALAPFALLAACATPADALAEDVRPADAAPAPALWRLGDADTTIYLFGTVHVLPDGVDWYDARIAAAFNASDELVTEVDVSDQAAMAGYVASAAALDDPRGLRGLMSEQSRSRYDTALTGLGLPVEAFDSYQPWFAALNLSVLPLLQAGYNPAAGVEMALAARAGGKARTHLETIEEQISIFAGLERDYQLTYLDLTVDGIDNVVPMIDEMVAVWLEGDAEKLATIMNSEMTDDYLYNRLLVQRNSNWVNWIENRLEQPGTVFIAVGAGHLAGPGSVQDQLQTRGHRVVRIWK
ncbi:TraB/GumN family protein [Altererythrobacter lauratis]|uniref:TraB/GumN family protein n=1 Tax=Alteraurantiacibacter lauratis TaxID=2054627 RepID=A0ABV7EDK1_9SPHN